MAKNGKPDFWDWIGINTKPDYTTLSPWAGNLIGFLLLLVLAFFAILALVTVGLLFRAVISQNLTTAPTAEDIRNLGLAAGAVIGVPFLVWRSIVAQKQVDVAEQGHITDRITKAVEGLGAEKNVSTRVRDVQWTEIVDGKELRKGFTQTWGQERDIKHRLPKPFQKMSEAEIDSGKHVRFGDWVDSTQTTPNLEVRIGALFALERISQDSDRDHVNVMEILCAYIRNNADRNSPALPDEEPEEGWKEWGEDNRTHLPLDVDVALKLLKGVTTAEKTSKKHTTMATGIALDLNAPHFMHLT